MLLTTKFGYRKGLGTCDALLCMSQTLQSALDSGLEAIGFRRLTSAQPLIVSTIREFSINSVCDHWRFCVVCIDTASIKSKTTCDGGWLLE